MVTLSALAFFRDASRWAGDFGGWVSVRVIAHDRDQNFVDEDTMLAACDVLKLIRSE